MLAKASRTSSSYGRPTTSCLAAGKCPQPCRVSGRWTYQGRTKTSFFFAPILPQLFRDVVLEMRSPTTCLKPLAAMPSAIPASDCSAPKKSRTLTKNHVAPGCFFHVPTHHPKAFYERGSCAPGNQDDAAALLARSCDDKIKTSAAHSQTTHFLKPTGSGHDFQENLLWSCNRHSSSNLLAQGQRKRGI